MTAVQTFVPGDIVVIGENDSGIRVGSSGEVIRLLDNGSVVVEVLPGKRYAVAPRHVSLKTSDRPERAVPPLWRIGDKVRCTHDVDDGPQAGTPGWAFGSHMVPGQVKAKFPEHGIMVVPSAELEPDPNQSSVSRARDAFRARLAEKRGHLATEVRAAATSVPKPEADPEGQEAPVKSLRNIWERQPAEETPLVETLAKVPQLLDEPPSRAPKKRKSRGPMSPEHKQALMASKERARAAREQAERERAHVSMTAACEVPPVDDVAKVEPAVVGNDAPQPATVDVLPAAPPPATGTWISWPSAPEGQWRGVVARECPTSAFNLTSSARRLLMDALAAREPIVRLTPLLVGDSRLLGAQGAVREGVAVMARVEFPDAPITEQEWRQRRAVERIQGDLSTEPFQDDLASVADFMQTRESCDVCEAQLDYDDDRIIAIELTGEADNIWWVSCPECGAPRQAM